MRAFADVVDAGSKESSAGFNMAYVIVIIIGIFLVIIVFVIIALILNRRFIASKEVCVSLEPSVYQRGAHRSVCWLVTMTKVKANG